MARMTEWMMAFAGAAVAGAAVYAWQRRAIGAKCHDLDKRREEAERLRSNAEIALASRGEEMERLRADAAGDLERQSRQYAGQIADLNEKLALSQKRTDEAVNEIARLKSAGAEAAARLTAEKNRVSDMTKHYEALLEQMKNEFKALSDEVLKEKREQLEKEGLAGVETITERLRKEIEGFRVSVENVNKEDIARTTALKKDIENLVSQTNLVSAEADKLATAIRSEAQVTGFWGEVQLRRVLELGGLQPTVDYDYQETFRSSGSDHADLRTDVLVKMPHDRWLVIDAKTTMSAYVDYVGEGGERDLSAGDRIVQSLVEHVKEMKTAEYHRKLEATTGKRILPMMLMYIPFEEVYLMAMKTEVDGTRGKMPLREWAWQNDVVFVNASGLIPLVRMLAELWDRDRSEKKVLQIKAAAESLIEKFKLFLEGVGSRKDGFLAIGTSLAQAVAAYNESVKRLSDGRGSVIKKLADLKEMGVTTAEKLPPPEQVAARQIDHSANI